MISVPRPLTTNDMASVAISALMRRRVTMRPLTSPTASPTPTPSAMATTGEVREASSALVTPARAYTAPTERSMPPATRTSVPAAAMIRIAAC